MSTRIEMRSLARCLLVLAAAAVLLSCRSTEQAVKHETAKDQGVFVPSAARIPAEARCPVCGMMPARYPDFAPKLHFTDGRMAAFDGCKDMFRFLLDMEKYGRGKTSEEVERIEVKDFGSGAWIDGRTAYYVAGSSVRGPMGPEILPFASREAAEAFRKEKGGEVLEFSGITAGVVEGL